ncbi:hypothetical protein QBC37DRAFT_145874 [Rhypophila decipiens]|uniref:F-box domain-containing protein n=1 Tax=Rhypophila decipiens TaxID=261697 RepID=A0AAN7B8U3_9PEZI|nr:hypothetical protein QBC37DRAFT_145874 [Rhypophila decipiens]
MRVRRKVKNWWMRASRLIKYEPLGTTLEFLPLRTNQLGLKIPRSALLTIRRKADKSYDRSSMGTLGLLPNELLLMILEYLDYQSLVRLRRTCFLGRELVESLPQFIFMCKAGPESISILRLNGMISRFPATTLCRSFLPGWCDFCLEFEEYPQVLIKTCQRICCDCLGSRSCLYPCDRNVHFLAPVRWGRDDKLGSYGWEIESYMTCPEPAWREDLPAWRENVQLNSRIPVEIGVLRQ